MMGLGPLAPAGGIPGEPLSIAELRAALSGLDSARTVCFQGEAILRGKLRDALAASTSSIPYVRAAPDACALPSG